jgi:hypothetical protein
MPLISLILSYVLALILNQTMLAMTAGKWLSISLVDNPMSTDFFSTAVVMGIMLALFATRMCRK